MFKKKSFLSDEKLKLQGKSSRSAEIREWTFFFASAASN